MSKYQIQHEIERLDWSGCWKNGKSVLDVQIKSAGFWAKKDNLHTVIESQVLEKEPELKNFLELKNQVRRFSSDFDEVNLTAQSVKKTLRMSMHPKHTVQREYFELHIRKGAQTWKLVSPLNHDCNQTVQNWVMRLREFFSTQADLGHFAFRQVEFMKPAFAQVLYYALGKRLNERFSTQPIQWPKDWKSFPVCNFDVWDVPGESDWLGYAPYGDDGVQGKRVKIYDGKNGEQNFVSARTGNSRCLDFQQSPEVHTRSLLVKSTDEKPPKDRQSTLIVENCESVVLRGDVVEVITNMQWMMSPYKKMLSLPPLKILVPLSAIPRFQVFEDSKPFHFIDGNDGRLSHGIGITVKCPSGWARSRLCGISFEPL